MTHMWLTDGFGTFYDSLGKSVCTHYEGIEFSLELNHSAIIARIVFVEYTIGSVVELKFGFPNVWQIFYKAKVLVK